MPARPAAVDGEDRFDFELAPGQGLAGTPVLATQLYPQTRIFTRNGLEVGTDAITAGKRAIVDAVLSLSNTDPDELRAALVILGAFVAPGSRACRLNPDHRAIPGQHA